MTVRTKEKSRRHKNQYTTLFQYQENLYKKIAFIDG